MTRQIDDMMGRLAKGLEIDRSTLPDDWAGLYGLIFGPAGWLAGYAATNADRAAWAMIPDRTDYYLAQEIIARLRELPPGGRHPQRTITLRVPAPVHRALRWEAWAAGASLNGWLTTKALALTPPRFVPAGPLLPPPAGIDRDGDNR